MPFILESEHVRNPEDIALDLFNMSKQPSYKEESIPAFLIKCMIMLFFALIIRIGFAQVIPSIFAVILDIITGIIVVPIIFYLVNLNGMFSKAQGFKGVMIFFGFVIITFVLLGRII